MTTRRRFIDSLGQFGVAGAMAPLVTACGTLRPSSPPPVAAHFDLVVIGTGFGGTMTALTVAYTLDGKLAGKRLASPLSILMLERGTWWTTPTETLQDKQVKTRDFLIRKGQPTQEWSSLSDYRGMLDLLRRCRYSDKRPQGLYDFAPIGKRGLFGTRNDGVSVLRASGVGGGSLVYSKILMRPPETLFDDPRWPGAWQGRKGAELRGRYYRRALEGVTHGVEALMPGNSSVDTGMSGPSQILTRAPGQRPAATDANVPAIPKADPQRALLQIRIRPDANRLVGREPELIDRARVFQTAISQLTPFYGTVDLSINDMAFAGAKSVGLKQPGINVCERHGRCNIGCLPGAGQTLNKQLMRAIFGKVATSTLDRVPAPDAGCVFQNVALQLTPLAAADHLSERTEGGYLVHYRQYRMDDPEAPPQNVVISADRVIVAAGCLGTSELLLRSHQCSVETNSAEGLRGLSARVGHGFSPNGDHIAFLAETKERVNLTFGPVTTSFGQFRPDAPQASGFHNIEDQGVPRAFAALTGHGVPLIQRLAHADGIERYVQALAGGLKVLHDVYDRTPDRTYAAASTADMSASRPESEDELTARMMCVVAQGKDDANGVFTLENDRMRLQREDREPYYKDRIYTEIHASLDKLAERLRPEGSTAKFVSPLFDKLLPGMTRTVLTSHPLGGCPMGESADTGVVDEWGRVYRQQAGQTTFFRGLYIADGSVIPTALGVNPALTISAVAMRVADKVLEEWDQIPARQVRTPLPRECLTPQPVKT
jgi:choline dehydrogenase-like flavoprotein